MTRLLPPGDCSFLLVKTMNKHRVKGGSDVLTSALELLVSVCQKIMNKHRVKGGYDVLTSALELLVSVGE